MRLLGVCRLIWWWFERCAAMRNTGISAKSDRCSSGAKKKAESGLLFGWLPSRKAVDAHSESAWNLMRSPNGAGGTGARMAIGGKRD